MRIPCRGYLCLIGYFSSWPLSFLFATTYTVINSNDSGAGSFRQAIINVNGAGAGSHTIAFNPSLGTINLLSDLPPITNSLATSIAITGNSNVVDGAGTYAALMSGSSLGSVLNVAISNLTVQNTNAVGGHGAGDTTTSGGGLGGGGLGAGGGIFVNGSATLTGITFDTCSATGGNGGSTGTPLSSGGNGGGGANFNTVSKTPAPGPASNVGGDGGGDNFGAGGAAGNPGSSGGLGGGGGGGAGAGAGSAFQGGTSTFGGGGGGGGRRAGAGVGSSGAGGNGGFGGGGGGSGSAVLGFQTIGAGGMAGTHGGAGGTGNTSSQTGGGGGGAGIGGCAFVYSSSSLTLDTVTFSGSFNAIGGVGVAGGGISGSNGSGVCTGIFLYNGATLTLQGTISMSIPIDGESTALDSGVTVQSGTTTFSVNNNYYGGTTFGSSGTGIITADLNLGDAAGTLTFNGGTLQVGNTITSNRQTTLSGAGTINVTGVNVYTFAGQVGGTGSLTKSGTGTLILSSIGNNYSGGTTLAAGTLQISSNANLGNTSTDLTVTGSSTLQLSATIASMARNMPISASQTLTIDTNTFDLTNSGIISGATGALTKISTGTLTLSGANTYGGGTTVTAGTLQGTTTSLQGDITNNSVVTFNQAGAGTYAGIMSGTGSLTKTGAGTVTLSGANTYSGGTTVAGGTLQGSTTSLQGNITNNSTVIFSQTTNGLYSGVISGTGSVSKQNTGTVTFSGANIYTGSTSVNGGTLSVSSESNLGTNSLIFNGGTLNISATFTMNRDVLVNAGSGTFDVDSGITLTHTGSMNGSTGSLFKTGAGTLVLQGLSFTRTGTTIFNAGTVSIAADNNLSAAGGALQFNGGTLNTSATFTMSRATTINAGGGTFDVDPTFTLTQNGVISGAGALTKTSAGTLSLGGASSYTGGTVISAGTVSAGANNNLGNAAGTLTFNGGTLNARATFTMNRATTINAGGGTFDVDPTFTLTQNGVISGTGALTKTDTGQLTLGGANTYSGGTTVTAGILEGTTTSLQGAITNNSAVQFNQAGAGTYSGVMSGTGSLTKLGTGTVTLSGANTYSGGTTVTAGILEGTTTSLQGAITNNAAVQFNQAGAGTYSGVMSGTGSLTKLGSGTVTLSGANTYSGGTVINAGTVSVGADNNLGNAAGTLTFNGGMLNASASFTTTRATTLSAGGGTFDVDPTFTLTHNGVISGTGALTKTNTGQLTLGVANTYSGGTTVSAGILEGTTTSLQGNVANNAAVQFNQAGAGTYSGVMSGTGTLTTLGAGNISLSGASTFTGGTTIQAGTISLTGSGSLASTGSVSVNSGTSVLDISGITAGSTTIGDLSGVAGSSVVLGSKTLVFGTATPSTTFQGVVSGTGSITKQGAGTAVLEAANTFSGTTTINGGTLSLSMAGDLNTASDVAIGAGATFDIAGITAASVTIDDLSGSGFITLGTKCLNFNSTTPSYTGVISGTGCLLKQNAGTAVLTGANTYSGGTTVSGGTLQGTTTSLQGNIVNNAALVFDQAGSGTYAGVISGTGTVTVSGGGTVTSTGANTYTGATTISNAQLSLSGVGTISSSASVNLSSASSVFDISGTAGTSVNNFSGVAGSVTNLDAQTLTFNNSAPTTYAGDFSCTTGGIVIAGPMTLTLTGTLCATGTTSVTGGTFTTTTTTLNNSNVSVSGGALLDILQGFAGSYSGVISGMGAVSVTGTSTVTFSGANTYTGGTSVSGGGTLQGTTTSLQGNIAVTSPSAVAFNQAGSGTYAGNLTGTGSVSIAGGGAVTFSGTNTYSGGTTVSAGSLIGGTGSVQGDILNNALVNLTGTGTYAGMMTGSGALTISGGGTITVTGINSFTGGTTINGSTLSLSGGGQLSSTGAVDLATAPAAFNINLLAGAGTSIGNLSGVAGTTINLGTKALTVNNSGNTTFSGDMSGAGGSLIKQGAGTLTLGGANTYTGGTTVSAGTLQGTTTSLQGSIVNNSIVDFNQAGAGTYAGVMSGTGQLTKQGAGTVTLSGANTYSGGTTISGGAFSISANNHLGTGSLTLNSGTLETTASLTSTHPIVLGAGGGTLQVDPATTLTQNGAITGAGSLTKTGTGILIVGATNTYTGGTTVSAGTLQGDASGIQGNIVNNGVVNFTQNTAGTYSGNMSGTGSLTMTGTNILTLSGTNTYSGGTTVSSGTVQGTTSSIQGAVANSSSVIFNQAGNGTYSGVMSGTGTLIKLGAGTVTLSGANTYSGATTISNGAFAVSADNNLGTGTLTLNAGTLEAIGSFTSTHPTTLGASGGAFQTDPGVTLTQSGIISGGGLLTKTGTGTLVLTGANTYTGGNAVTAGILQGDTTTILGNIANSANVTFNQAVAGSFGGVISGSGSLTKTGGGTLTLTAANTYSGGTTISAGCLQGTTSTLQGTIVNNSCAIFNQAFSGSYISSMSGTGSLQITGGGTVNLTAPHTYSGGTTVDPGNTVNGFTGSIQGNFINNGQTCFSQSFDGVYSDMISGVGDVCKYGSGTINYTNANVMGNYYGYEGGTALNGSFGVSGLATIYNGASFSGNGTLTGDLFLDGLISPGNSIGTITIMGDATFTPASSMLIEFNQTATDLIVLTGTGNLTLNAPTLILSPEPIIYSFPFSHRIIDAVALSGAGVVGTVVNPFLLISPVVTYNYLAGDVFIELALGSNPFATLGLTGNAAQTAKCLDQFILNPCGNFLDTLNVLASMTQVEEIELALLEIQPSQLSSLALVEESSLFYLRSKVTDEMHARRERCEAKQANIHAWGSAIGGYSQQNNIKQEPGYQAMSGGAAIGADGKLGASGLLGVDLGYLFNDMYWKNARGRSTLQNLYAGLYGGYEAWGGYVQGSLLGGYTFYETRRDITFGMHNAVNVHPKGSFHGFEGDASLEAGIPVRFNAWSITPFVGAAYSALYQQKHTETGADSLNLTIEGHAADLLTSQGGFAFRICEEKDDLKLALFGSVSAISENRFHGNKIKSAFHCDCMMQVKGMYPSRLLLGTALGAEASFGNNNLSLSYDGKYSRKFQDHSLFLNYSRGF